MFLIKCENCSFEFDSKKVLDNISFSVYKDDYLCIVGENGCGKSTLIKGLLKLKAPSAGEIIYGDGFTLSDIGYLPQGSSVQKDFPATVWEVVLSGRLNSKGLIPFYTKADKEAAEYNLNLLSIANLKHKCFRELSVGQQQRTLLARAFCACKKLLVLDEPVSALDPLASADLYDIIAKINKEKQIAIVMVSHDVKNAVEHAKTILHIEAGKGFWGKTSDYINSYGKAFLGGRAQENENGGGK
jgi:zinc transport system ATP-binding protein